VLIGTEAGTELEEAQPQETRSSSGTNSLRMARVVWSLIAILYSGFYLAEPGSFVMNDRVAGKFDIATR